MYKVIESSVYQVWAIETMRDGYGFECPAIDFLFMHAKQKQYKASAIGFKALFKRYANGGRANLTTDQLHEVDKKNGIWEFIKGDLRVFCFFHNGHAVLCNSAIKKSQKVDSKEVECAIRAKRSLLTQLQVLK